MRVDVAKALTESAQDFLDVVWPVVREEPEFAGGELIQVEGTHTEAMRRHLDILGGIDAWLIQRPENRMAGIAVRIQWRSRSGKDYKTFTIRRRLRSGRPTEYHKRVTAIFGCGDYLFPMWTVQAYLDDVGGRILSYGIVPTRTLFEYILAREHDAHWLERHVNRARDGGQEFLYVAFSDLGVECSYRDMEQPWLPDRP